MPKKIYGSSLGAILGIDRTLLAVVNLDSQMDTQRSVVDYGHSAGELDYLQIRTGNAFI